MILEDDDKIKIMNTIAELEKLNSELWEADSKGDTTELAFILGQITGVAKRTERNCLKMMSDVV